MSLPSLLAAFEHMLGQVTQAVKTIQAKLIFPKPALKPKSPEVCCGTLGTGMVGGIKPRFILYMTATYLVGVPTHDIVVRNPCCSSDSPTKYYGFKSTARLPPKMKTQ